MEYYMDNIILQSSHDEAGLAVFDSVSSGNSGRSLRSNPLASSHRPPARRTLHCTTWRHNTARCVCVYNLRPCDVTLV